VFFTGSTGAISAPFHVGTGSTASSGYSGVFSVGSLNYSDSNILASFASNVNSYNQMVLQNTSNGSVASTNFNVSNNNANATAGFGEFGINSTGFTGTGAFSQANNVYLAAATSDLAIGTYASNAIHFVVNSGATDAMTINPSGAIGFSGSYGTSGQILESLGSGAAPVWVNFSGGATLGNATANSVYYPVFANATTGTFSSANVSASYTFNPGTGDLVAPQHIASNGLLENANTVSTSYVVTAGRNALSVGPMTVNSGVTVTIPAGNRWVVL